MSKSKRPKQNGLVKRFTSAQAELAAKISNDIAEGIDCGESRQKLRMAVAYFADVACVERMRSRDLEANVKMFKAAKALMDSVLQHELTP